MYDFTIQKNMLCVANYLLELMNPSKEYGFLAMNTISYLFSFLENYCSAYDLGIELDKNEYEIIEENSYSLIE